MFSRISQGAIHRTIPPEWCDKSHPYSAQTTSTRFSPTLFQMPPAPIECVTLQTALPCFGGADILVCHGWMSGGCTHPP
ncbi:MAG TPA: hypothetical protein VIL86_12200, partial [Tepidisphaeraceae bacterium]